MTTNPILPTTINLISPECTTSDYSSSESDDDCKSDEDDCNKLDNKPNDDNTKLDFTARRMAIYYYYSKIL